MLIDKSFLKEAAAGYSITLSEQMLEMFDVYARFLVEYNEKVNLTAITAPEDITVKHFLDSLLILEAASPPRSASLIDIGTGAGFPALPIKIVRDDISVTLLDSLKKRVVFLNELCGRLNIVPQAIIHARAEQGCGPGMREAFDYAAARAVAPLAALAEYCLPYVKPGGTFIALKGFGCEAEIAGAANALRLLGGVVGTVRKYHLPDNSGRAIILIKKISQTSPKYPRKACSITKKPL